MIVEYVHCSIDAVQRAAFEATYAKAGVVLSRSLNCLDWELTRCHEDPSSYVLRIRWDSIDGHLRTFRGSGLFQDFVTAIRDYIPAIVEMRHYEVIGHR